MPVISLLNAIWDLCVVHTCPPIEENSNNDFSKSVAFWRKKLLSNISFVGYFHKSKKVMILQLEPQFKKCMFNIQGNNYKSMGEKGFLMNFLDNLPDLVIFLVII